MFDLLPITLRLFDGAAAGAEGAGADGAQTAGQTAEGETVLYGKQDNVPDAGEQKAKPTPEERKNAYNKLVNEDYKDLDSERIQGIINKRFKETKGLQERADRMSEVVSVLASRYGVDPDNLDALRQAIDRDDSFWEDAAADAGMSVSAFKEYRQAKTQLDALMKKDLATQKEAEMHRQIAKWQEEAEECGAAYPDFDMGTETQNKDFVELLKRGVSVKHAYEIMHIDDIKAAQAQKSAAETERKVVENIRAKGSRPSENALSGKGSVVVKRDVHALTKKDRAEIMRRVAKGEKIGF